MVQFHLLCFNLSDVSETVQNSDFYLSLCWEILSPFSSPFQKGFAFLLFQHDFVLLFVFTENQKSHCRLRVPFWKENKSTEDRPLFCCLIYITSDQFSWKVRFETERHPGHQDRFFRKEIDLACGFSLIKNNRKWHAESLHETSSNRGL